MFTASQPRPADSTPSAPVTDAITIVVELAEIGRAIELHPEPWAWSAAQRVFRASTELRHVIAETYR